MDGREVNDENTLRVDAYIFCKRRKISGLKNIRICVDEALVFQSRKNKFAIFDFILQRFIYFFVLFSFRFVVFLFLFFFWT